MKIKFLDTGEIQEVVSAHQLANTKVRVTPETSRQIQEEVLRLGVKWINGRSEVLWTESPFLFFMPDFGKVALSHLPKGNGNWFKRSYCREFVLLPSLSSPSELQDSNSEREQVIDVLSDCILQIEYLHDKFTATGTGNNVLSRARALLQKLETLKS